MVDTVGGIPAGVDLDKKEPAKPWSMTITYPRSQSTTLPPEVPVPETSPATPPAAPAAPAEPTRMPELRTTP